MSALEELQELFNVDPDTERISLRAKQLEHIDAEMEYLHLHFAHVRHLDLSANELEALPIDFGELLPKLVALDITKNRFRSVADLADVLQKCASLKSLSVTLKSATEEKLLLVMLPKLRILNGTPLSSPASPPSTSTQAHEPPVKAVHALSMVLLSPSTASNSSVDEGDGDLHHQRLSPPPTPRSSTIASPQDKRTLRLQFANLKIERQAVEQERQRSAASHAQDTLVLTKKKSRRSAATSTTTTTTSYSGLASVSASGSSHPVRAKSTSVRPTEKPATISDDKTDWHKLLKSQAPAVAPRNEQQLQLPPPREATVVSTTTESFLTQLKTVVKTFHQCDAKDKPDDSSSNSSQSTQLMVYEQLDRHVDLLASQLSRQESEQHQESAEPYKSNASSTSASAAVASDIACMKKSLAMLQTRWNLLEICGMYGVEKANGVDDTLGKAFEKLLQMQKEVLVALQHQQATIAAKAQLVSKSQDPGTNGKANSTNTQQHEQQMKVLLEVAECLESDLEAVQTRLQQEKAQRELLEQENWSLKRENEAFKRKPRANSNPNSSIAASATPQALLASMSEREGTLAGVRQRIRKRTTTPAAATIASSEPHAGSHAAMQTSPLVPKQKSPGTKVSATGVPSHAAESPPPVPVLIPARIRNLTLKQLVDLVQCITASKLKFDTRSFEVGAPRETMEQHMYTYLNQRFGLKPLIVDYASAIWKGCEAFQKQENDAKMFLALLKNQVDEGFLGIKKKLKQALVDLLRAYFQAKYPLKQELAIATLVQNRIQNQIHEEEWQEMLTYLYDPQDSLTLLRLVKQKAEKLQQQLSHNQRQRQTRTTSLKTKASGSVPASLPFVVFEQVLYDYQLQGRIKLLEEFRQAFESYDSERVGIVNHESFGLIARRIAPKKSASTIEKLLETLDPFQHDVVTFSDAVTCLMGDIRSKWPSPPKPTLAPFTANAAYTKTKS